MASVTEILKLCRLCLVNDQVNIPIFEEQGDIRQIFLKITACLPIKVSREDNLPKKICDGCLYKLELLYQFWNTTANAEKQLLTWLNQAGIEADSKTTQEAVAIALQTQAEHSVKEEVIDPPENTPEETAGDLTTEAESFLLQKQLPLEPAGAQLSKPGFTKSQEDGSHVDASSLEDPSLVNKSPPVDKKVDKSQLDDTIEGSNLGSNVDSNNDDSNMDDGGGPSEDEESEEEYQPPPKRPRRQAAIKAAKLVAQERDDDEQEDENEQEEDDYEQEGEEDEEENEEDVDDPELGTAVPKTEQDSEDEGADPEATNFVSVGTGDMEGAEEEDNVKPGPSGVGKVDPEAP